MFTVAAMNGNNPSMLIAFGVGVENNVDSYTWFLMRLKETLREAREVHNQYGRFINFFRR